MEDQEKNIVEIVLRDAKENKLTSHEQTMLRARLSYFMRAYTGKHSFFLWATMRYAFVFVLIFALLIVGAHTTYASQQILPGNILYPIKVSVVEPAIGLFQFSAQSKADWDTQLIQTRLREAELLASQGKMTAYIADELAHTLDQTIAGAQKNIQKLTQENKNDAVERAQEQLDLALEVHGGALSVLLSSNPQIDTIHPNENSIIAVAQGAALAVLTENTEQKEALNNKLKQDVSEVKELINNGQSLIDARTHEIISSIEDESVVLESTSTNEISTGYQIGMKRKVIRNIKIKLLTEEELRLVKEKKELPILIKPERSKPIENITTSTQDPIKLPISKKVPTPVVSPGEKIKKDVGNEIMPSDTIINPPSGAKGSDNVVVPITPSQNNPSLFNEIVKPVRIMLRIDSE